jgi:hypothetical protein
VVEAELEVINAFRHQRFLHLPNLFGQAGGGISDQRLSASKIFAPVRIGNVLKILSVINAFRHQRFLHI